MALRDEYPAAMTESGKSIPFLHCHGDEDRIVQFAWGKKRCGHSLLPGILLMRLSLYPRGHGLGVLSYSIPNILMWTLMTYLRFVRVFDF